MAPCEPERTRCGSANRINELRLNGGYEGYPKSLQVIEKMERETGFEPATSSLGSWHSTTELLPLAVGSARKVNTECPCAALPMEKHPLHDPLKIAYPPPRRDSRPGG